jgi:uncharacterized membrane protein
MAANATVEIFRGEDVAVVCTATETTNITDWDLAFTVAVPGGSVVLTVTTATAAIGLTTPLTGVFTVNLTRAQTSALTLRLYRFDVWRTDSGSNQRLVGGDLIVNSGIRPPA